MTRKDQLPEIISKLRAELLEWRREQWAHLLQHRPNAAKRACQEVMLAEVRLSRAVDIEARVNA